MAIHVRSRSTSLAYALATQPAMLTAGAADRARLTFTLRQATIDTFLRSIEIMLPIGAAATDLTNVTLGLTAVITGPGTETWTPSQRTEGGFVLFAFRPPTPMPLPTGWSAQITVSQIAINGATGIASIDIIEETGRTNDSPIFRATSIDVQKFPTGSFFEDLTPSAVAVPNGAPVTLSWKGSPATYTMFWNDQHVDVSSTSVDGDGRRRWTSPPLTAVTGFMLQFSTTQHGDSLVYSLTTAVTVGNPDLITTAINASRALTVGANGVTLTPTAATFEVPVRLGELTVDSSAASSVQFGTVTRAAEVTTTAELQPTSFRGPGSAIWDGDNRVRVFGARRSVPNFGPDPFDVDIFVLVRVPGADDQTYTVDGRNYLVKSGTAAILFVPAGSILVGQSTYYMSLFPVGELPT